MATDEKDKQKIFFDDQAFLWDFIKVFQNTHTTTAGSGYEPRRNEYKCLYSNFIQLNDKSPVLTVNRMYAEGSNALHNATTAQMSSLVPKFRLYKSIKNGNQEKNIEFPFKKFTTVDSIINSSLGRGDDVGFISVNWTDTGTNPANVGVSFSGDITLKFQSFEALFKLRESDGEKIAFADLLNPEESVGKRTTEQKTEQKDQIDDSNTEDLKTEIKMVVGWEVPTDPGNNLDIKSIEDELSNLQRTYIIKNLDHNIDIDSQNASITVTIKFSARIEGMLLSTRTDLLYVDPANEGEIDKKAKKSLELDKKNLISKKKEIKEKIKKAKEKINQNNNQKTTSGNTDLNKDIEVLRSELEGINDKIKYNISETRAIAYRRLLTALRSNISDPTPNSDGKIKYVDLDESTFRGYLSVLENASKSKEELADKQKNIREASKKENAARLADPTISQEEKNKINKRTQVQVKDASESFQEEYRSQRTESITKLEAKITKAVNSPNDPNQKANVGLDDSQIVYPDLNDKNYEPKFYSPAPGTIRVHYFYLGDLIEAVMDVVYKRSLTKGNKLDNVDQVQDKNIYDQVKLILGPFVYYNPVTEESINMAMCDIPISLNYFNAWFFDNVVKRGLTNYTLRNFLRDLCSKLLNNVMSPTRYGVINPIKSFSTRLQSVRMQKDADLNKYWIQEYQSPKLRINVDGLLRSIRKKSGESSQHSSIKQTEWIYLYTVGSNSDFLAKQKGSSAFNISNEIPHYYIGGQKGVLKSVNFSRTQIPGKLEAALSAGGDPTRKNLLFQNKYDAEIEIFGNPVFKPGMLIYLDPRGIGLGSIDTYSTSKSPNSVDFRYDLGIGGYYRVVNVSNDLANGAFTTKITTVAELDLRDMRILNKKQTAKTN